eukprot:scaffold129363_cov63-Phaeocystis_antarctica.AAC.2
MVRLAPSCALVSEVGPSLPEIASAPKASRKETRTREVMQASGTKLLSSHCKIVSKQLLTCKATASELPVSIAAGSVVGEVTLCTIIVHRHKVGSPGERKLERRTHGSAHVRRGAAQCAAARIGAGHREGVACQRDHHSEDIDVGTGLGGFEAATHGAAVAHGEVRQREARLEIERGRARRRAAQRGGGGRARRHERRVAVDADAHRRAAVAARAPRSDGVVGARSCDAGGAGDLAGGAVDEQPGGQRGIRAEDQIAIAAVVARRGEARGLASEQVLRATEGRGQMELRWNLEDAQANDRAGVACGVGGDDGESFGHLLHDGGRPSEGACLIVEREAGGQVHEWEDGEGDRRTVDRLRLHGWGECRARAAGVKRHVVPAAKLGARSPARRGVPSDAYATRPVVATTARVYTPWKRSEVLSAASVLSLCSSSRGDAMPPGLSVKSTRPLPAAPPLGRTSWKPSCA